MYILGVLTGILAMLVAWYVDSLIAPSIVNPITRFKAWWPEFVKRHIVDVDPYDGKPDPKSPTRYVPEQYVDWEKLEPWAKYVAVDATEIAWQYEIAPILLKSQGWARYLLNLQIVPMNAITAPLPPWRESLRKRPE